MQLYRYTYKLEDGSFNSSNSAFESDTEARANIFAWYLNSEHITALWLFRYNSMDKLDSFRLIDHLERTSIIKF